jgi:hypothetical protein
MTWLVKAINELQSLRQWPGADKPPPVRLVTQLSSVQPISVRRIHKVVPGFWREDRFAGQRELFGIPFQNHSSRL